MRKSILIAAMITVTYTAAAQLTIIDQDYELAKRTAAQQQKLLIVDFYTTWCVPCKILDKTIFKNDSIADKISKNFVVLKYDAEKDTIHHLSLKHHVCSYPTTIVLSSEGELIHKMFGTGGTGSLVVNYTHLLKESILLNQQGKYIEGYPATIDPYIYPEFYKKYIRRTADIKHDDLSNYWANNKDLESEVSFAILAYFGKAPQRVVNFFIQHKPEYEQRFGKADVKFIINRVTSDKFSAAIAEKDEAQYEAAIQFAKQQLPPDDAAEYIKAYRLEMYIAMEKWDEAIHNMEERIRLKTISDNEINYSCWTIYEKCEEKKAIGRAADLMKNIVVIHPSFAMLDTYARLLYKNGNKEAAITVMKSAIEKGKTNGEDTKESEEALSKF